MGLILLAANKKCVNKHIVCILTRGTPILVQCRCLGIHHYKYFTYTQSDTTVYILQEKNLHYFSASASK